MASDRGCCLISFFTKTDCNQKEAEPKLSKKVTKKIKSNNFGPKRPSEAKKLERNLLGQGIHVVIKLESPGRSWKFRAEAGNFAPKLEGSS